MASKIIDEYFQATAQRLYNYPQYKVMLRNAIDYQNRTVEKLSAAPGTISQYSERMAADTNEKATGPEAFALRQEQAGRDLWKANRSVDYLQSIVHPLEYALLVLTPDELTVICLRYWGVTCTAMLTQGNRGIRWEEFEKYGYSMSTAKRISNNARRKIREMIFPYHVDDGNGIIAVE